MESEKQGSEKRTVKIRSAEVADSAFVAWTVLTALDLTSDDLSRVVSSCRDERSLYSYRNAIVAEVDGRCVGCLIAYAGADYRRMREYTWPTLWNDFDPEYLLSVAEETLAGEYYLDSMAILPEYRGLEIGKRLIQKGVEKGEALGLKRCGLIVDFNKPRLKSYYESCGFRESGEIEFFGHRYHRMLRISERFSICKE